jgi:hypothetical protein
MCAGCETARFNSVNYFGDTVLEAITGITHFAQILIADYSEFWSFKYVRYKDAR